MSDCDVCGDDAVGLFVCSSCANEADDRLRKEQRDLGRKEGAKNELKRILLLGEQKVQAEGKCTGRYLKTKIEERLEELK